MNKEARTMGRNRNPHCYMFQWVTFIDGRGREERFFAPADCNGFFPTHEAWQELVEYAARFYALVPPAVIKEANKRALAQWAEMQNGKSQEAHGAPKRSLQGYVYLLKGGDYCKIGRSNNPDRRLEEISPQLPFSVELICMVATNDMYKLEARLHQRYADKRANGEWFRLDGEDITCIKELADVKGGKI